MRKITAAAATLSLLVTPVAVAQAPAPSLSDMLNLCRLIVIVDPAKGKAIFETLPADVKPTVAALCVGYKQGTEDVLEVLRGDPVKAKSI